MITETTLALFDFKRVQVRDGYEWHFRRLILHDSGDNNFFYRNGNYPVKVDTQKKLDMLIELMA